MPSPRAGPGAQAVLLLVLFGPLIAEWAETCAASSRLSYALLVPLLAAVLGWRAHATPATSLPAGRAGLASALAAGLAAGLLVCGGLTGLFTLSLLALPTAAVAWVARRGGWVAVRQQGAALALLFLMVPPPMPIMDRISPTLVALSGRTALALLWPFDASATWVGSSLGFRGWDLVVAEVCSGSGTFLTLAVLGAFLAGLFRMNARAAALVVALSFPLTLAVNGLRIAGSALAIDTFGARAGAGLPHELLGQGVVLGGAALLVWAVERHARRHVGGGEAHA